MTHKISNCRKTCRADTKTTSLHTYATQPTAPMWCNVIWHTNLIYVTQHDAYHQVLLWPPWLWRISCTYTLRLTQYLHSGTSGTSRILSRSEYGQLCVHIQGCPADTQAPTHWNLISRSMTASSPALSPSSILPPLFISVRFNFCKDISARLSKVLLFPTLSYTFLKIA